MLGSLLRTPSPHPPPASPGTAGAYFGTTFSHLFLLTYPSLRPPKATEKYTPRVFGFKIHPSAYQQRSDASHQNRQRCSGGGDGSSQQVQGNSSAAAAAAAAAVASGGQQQHMGSGHQAASSKQQQKESCGR